MTSRVFYRFTLNSQVGNGVETEWFREETKGHVSQAKAPVHVEELGWVKQCILLPPGTHKSWGREYAWLG